MKTDLQIIDRANDINDVFGSHSFLNEFNTTEYPAIYEFARIILNYTKMKKISNENRNKKHS